MRQNIFDVAKASLSIKSDINRITTILQNEDTLIEGRRQYNIFEFVDIYCFEEWSRREHFLDVDDYLKSINYKRLVDWAKLENMDSVLLLLELAYNFWYLANTCLLAEDSRFCWFGNFYHLQTIINDMLENLNFKAYIEGDAVYVIEDKPEVTAVAEIVDEPLALDTIRYNHFSMRGDLAGKKKVLLALADYLEPKRKELNKINQKAFAEKLFMLFNKLNIRHNNCDSNSDKYVPRVASMSEEELEGWYDETYQMALLAILMLDNQERTTRVSALIEEINGGKNGTT